ncbi:hypothetical protein KUCAC02_005120 [Chaenocephalus aceratus]|uniref:Uncharacterized protein n=1 Tax=Chaenocephalus aceratus TaxID=36190 RepID=A0ACB9WMH2_CHAAC|nr:hypothetical protein KUCAC02_005120 [Chaenocephalus aceratus]
MCRADSSTGAKKLKGTLSAHKPSRETEHPRPGARGAPGGGEKLQGPFQDQKKGAKLAGLAEQSIIFSGVGLALGSHGEEEQVLSVIPVAIWVSGIQPFDKPFRTVVPKYEELVHYSGSEGMSLGGYADDVRTLPPPHYGPPIIPDSLKHHKDQIYG